MVLLITNSQWLISKKLGSRRDKIKQRRWQKIRSRGSKTRDENLFKKFRIWI